jgi:hypothetical protein
MGTADGAVLGSTQIVDKGATAERFNLVLISEGYQAARPASARGGKQSGRRRRLGGLGIGEPYRSSPSS